MALPRTTGNLVILSGAIPSRSEAIAESKDPYLTEVMALRVPEFSALLALTILRDSPLIA
ncbi:MAG: hypothetical protein ABSD39_04860 [Terriglobales bacterium]|jgi:hypothetical protein